MRVEGLPNKDREPAQLYDMLSKACQLYLGKIMTGKLLPRNTFLLALMVLFCTISLLPMNLFAEKVDTDHDNMYVNNTASQTSLGVSYFDNDPDYVYCSAYGNIWNNSDISVRYYFSATLSVLRKGRILYDEKPDKKWGWVPAGESKSFIPFFTIDMTGAKKAPYTANGDVTLELKFDFNGDGDFDDIASVGSFASITFDYK